jgi:hypothetical protein
MTTMAADAESIAGLKSLGPKSAAMLAAAGITTPAQLRRLGAVAAYESQPRHSGVSLNFAVGAGGPDWIALAGSGATIVPGCCWHSMRTSVRTRRLRSTTRRQPLPRRLSQGHACSWHCRPQPSKSHHAATSFRVSGKIFATVPPDACSLNLFVDDVMREQMVATWPDAFENLLWGGKVAGLAQTCSGPIRRRSSGCCSARGSARRRVACCLTVMRRPLSPRAAPGREKNPLIVHNWCSCRPSMMKLPVTCAKPPPQAN